ISLRLRLSAASSAEPTTAPGGVRTKKVRPITDTTAEIVPSRMKLDCQPHVSVKRPATWGNSGALVADRSEEHTSELQSLMRNSYGVFCLKKQKIYNTRR